MCHDDIKWRRISHLQGQTQETVRLLKMVLKVHLYFVLFALGQRERKSHRWSCGGSHPGCGQFALVANHPR